MTLRRLGKLLQIFALILLPASMVMQLTGFLGRPIGIAEMLLMLIFGVVAFVLGRLVEGYASR